MLPRSSPFLTTNPPECFRKASPRRMCSRHTHAAAQVRKGGVVFAQLSLSYWYVGKTVDSVLCIGSDQRDMRAKPRPAPIDTFSTQSAISFSCLATAEATCCGIVRTSRICRLPCFPIFLLLLRSLATAARQVTFYHSWQWVVGSEAEDSNLRALSLPKSAYLWSTPSITSKCPVETNGGFFSYTNE